MDSLHSLGATFDQPSFFEVAAQERILPSLFSAFEHAITVMASRHTRLLRVHKYRDEVFYILVLFVQRQSLALSNGSLSESLFGLRRVDVSLGTLPDKKRRLSLLFLAFLPYLERKLERLCAPEIPDGDDENEFVGDMNQATNPQSLFSMPTEVRDWVRLSVPATWRRAGGLRETTLSIGGPWTGIRSWIKMLYPWIHAGKEAAVLTFFVLFLFNRISCSSPWLKILNLELRRLSSEYAQKLAAEVAAARARQLEMAGRLWSPVLRAAARLLLWVWHGGNDNFKVAAILVALLVKIADWWLSEQAPAAGPAAPIPPPPRRPPVVDRAAIPINREVCGLCRQHRTNPAVASSGYVFCYPCLMRHVLQHASCPISGLPCSPEQVVRSSTKK